MKPFPPDVRQQVEQSLDDEHKRLHFLLEKELAHLRAVRYRSRLVSRIKKRAGTTQAEWWEFESCLLEAQQQAHEQESRFLRKEIQKCQILLEASKQNLVFP